MSRGKKSPGTPKIPNTLNMKTLKIDFFFYCLKTIDGQIIFSRCLSEYVLLCMVVIFLVKVNFGHLPFFYSVVVSLEQV